VDEQLVESLVEQARADGLSLTGADAWWRWNDTPFDAQFAGADQPWRTRMIRQVQ